MKKLFGLLVVVFCFVFVSSVFAASPDASGPWADAVVTSSQASTKAAGPVSTVNPARSNPDSAVGVAENSNEDGNFFSLGFGGSITLRFDNGVRDGVIVVESTFPEYQIEKASVEVSADGVSWSSAGTVSQDGEVSMPEGVTCANYVRITDVSNPEDFTEDTADGYDVDGVQATNGEACEGQTSPTPTPTQAAGDNNGGNGGNNTSNGGGTGGACGDLKPPTPSLTGVTRTSPTTAKLTWSSVYPVTTYAISYGTSTDNYQYGVPSTGNVTEFTVGGLDPSATYYFKVYAVNGCMPGDPSAETASGQTLGAGIGGDVLGASTDTLAATGSWGQLVQLGKAIGASLITFALLSILAHGKNSSSKTA